MRYCPDCGSRLKTVATTAGLSALDCPKCDYERLR